MDKQTALKIVELISMKDFFILENTKYGGFCIPQGVIDAFNRLDNHKTINQSWEELINFENRTKQYAPKLEKFLFRTDLDLIRLIQEAKEINRYEELKDIEVRRFEVDFHFETNDNDGIENISVGIDFFKLIK